MPGSASAVERAAVLDVDFYRGNVDSAAAMVVDRVAGGEGGYACFCNVHVLMTARRSRAVMQALDDAWMVFPDGAPIAWSMRWAGNDSARRVGGPDLMARVLDLGRAAGLRHGFYGSTPDVLDDLSETVGRRFPGALVSAAIAPPFGDLEDREVEHHVAEIRAADVDVLWIGLGAPRQELWMTRFAGHVRPAVCLGVGAAFDFLAGRKARAPRWMQRAGLEWAHRLASEPRRLSRRYLVSNTRFIAALGRDLVQRRTAP
jgi:N-acetylglucosaminyldiphosphoundecaprenol N-acetyl-beta-D-mannosaminyltransferase